MNRILMDVDPEGWPVPGDAGPVGFPSAQAPRHDGGASILESLLAGKTEAFEGVLPFHVPPGGVLGYLCCSGASAGGPDQAALLEPVTHTIHVPSPGSMVCIAAAALVLLVHRKR